MPDEFKAKELNQFINSGDRVINPFFGGREVYQKKIDKLTKRIAQRHEENVSDVADGMTQVIYGAPGIGKSSLLKKIRQNCIDQLNNDTPGPKTIPVMLNDPENLSFEYLGRRIHDTISELLPFLTIDGAKNTVRNTLKSLASVSVGGFSRGIHKTTSTDPIIPKGLSIILMIDEIQGVSKEAAGVLLRLHTGSNGLPILPILAGLSTSPGILSERKVSRLASDSEHPLPPLTHDEIKESFTKFVDYFNITSTPEVTNAWSERIVNWADGWPKHVENSQAAMGQQLLVTDGDLTKVNPRLAKCSAAEIRCGYYNQRFGRYDQDPQIIGEIMAQLGPNPNRGFDITMAINRIVNKPVWAETITSNQLPALNLKYLLHHGLIDKHPLGNVLSGTYKCPIPSLQSYAVAKTGTSLHFYVCAGDKPLIVDALKYNSDINAVDDWGRTPLHLSAQNDWVEITQMLLDEGADPQIRDHRNRRPLEMTQEGSETYDMIYQATHVPPTPEPPGLDDGEDYEPSF